MRPDYIIEYLFRQGQLTAPSGNPFDYVTFKDEGAGNYSILQWKFQEPQVNLATVAATGAYQTYEANRTKIHEREEARKKFDTDMRRFALTVLDENNSLRDWITQFKAAVAASTTLANLKTGIAALPAMPQRTAAQLKAAMDAKD